MIVIVDYGMGNLGSILNMLKKIGAPPSIISSDPKEIQGAKKLILPGVGAFDTGMTNLKASGLVSILNEQVLVKKIPVLGVCLGMQLLGKGSEEGSENGLGWIDAESKHFHFDLENSHLRIPHMGWNQVSPSSDARLFQGFVELPRFYFVHSYHVVCADTKVVAATTHYGYDFTAAVQQENIMGTQFHPEKSHRFGMKIYRNFLESN